MLKVFLPSRGGANFDEVTDKALRDVCHRIFGSDVFDKAYEDRKDGQYFRIVDTNSGAEHFILFNNANRSRNTRLIQPFPVGYVDFLTSPVTRKYIYIYFINPTSDDRTAYAKLFYRCFMTLGIRLLNFEVLGLTGLTAYENYDDLKNERNANRDRNSHNASSYFEENPDDVTIFGKNDGVNEKESFILALTIATIVSGRKPVIFYPVKKDMSQKYAQVLMDAGVTFEPKIDTLATGEARAAPSEEIDDIRNTKIYHLNLHRKFGHKQCYFCGCDMEHMIIGAHIERVADIKREAAYGRAEKFERAVDGDNGLWLCANHDKMFEFGMVHFAKDVLQVGAFLTNELDKKFIYQSIFETHPRYAMGSSSVGQVQGNVFKIRTLHYTAKMAEYIGRHMARIA